MKPPPDKYKCIKMPLHKILDLKSPCYNTIEDAVIRANKITIKTYLVLKLWFLYKYDTYGNIPVLTKEEIMLCMQTLKIKSQKPKSHYVQLHKEFTSLVELGKEDGAGLTQILNYKSITMITMIENNIKFHFIDYLKRFVKLTFPEEPKVYKIVNDVINNTFTSEDMYHDWIVLNKPNILPEIGDTKFAFYNDLQSNPQRYIKHMIWMNREIENMGGKLLQFMPLQTSIIPKFIDIDTATLKIFTKSDDWSIFNIKAKIKKYTFDGNISTDGYSVSIRFINNKYIESKIQKHKNMQAGKEKLKGKSKEEKKEISEEKKKQRATQYQEKCKEEFVCECGSTISIGSKSSHMKSQKHKQYMKENNIFRDDIEFPYITEVDKKDLVGKHIFIDPGKRDLFSMLDDDGKQMKYSNRQRIVGTKRLESLKKLKKHKDKNGICEIENTLSNFNSKTSDTLKFKEYILKKIEINELLYQHYQHKKFRQQQFYSYINTKRCEDEMLNSIEKTYGKDSIVIIGDWSTGEQMRNFISTPNLSLKRKLKERFKVFNIDEFRTSCLHHETEEKMNNLKVKSWYKRTREDIEPTTRKLHSVLTFKMENKRLGCINRDYNGCLNIRKIFYSYLNHDTRPERYCRSYKLTNNDSNPFNGVK
jgi:hypothetical protein